MNISPSSNQTSPAFKGSEVVYINRIEEKLRPKVVEEIIQKVGLGIIPKSYQHGNDNIPHDIFVGINNLEPGNAKSPVDKIVVAMGEDFGLLRNGEVRAKAEAKCNQIDLKVNNMIFEVLQNHGIAPRSVMDSNRIGTGGFRRIFGKIVARVNSVADGSAVYTYKRNGSNFEHIATEVVE